MRTERRAFLLLLVAAAACRDEPTPSVAAGRLIRAREGPSRALLALSPTQARVGEIFQKQPTGEAALAAMGAGFSRGDVIHWNGRPLDTTFAHSRLLTAIVPSELLLTRPGVVEVTVENPDPGFPRLRAELPILPAE